MRIRATLTVKRVSFTPREVDVISCMVVGVTDTKSIATVLDSSTSTIENHICSVLAKLRLSSRKCSGAYLEKVVSRKKLLELTKHYVSLLEDSSVVPAPIAWRKLLLLKQGYAAVGRMRIERAIELLSISCLVIVTVSYFYGNTAE